MKGLLLSDSRPDIYFFNPTCEYAVANGQPSWQPNKLLQTMESELGLIPMYLAGENDIVLVKQTPSASFFESLENFGIKVPQIEPVETVSSLPERIPGAINRLLPWGWSPAVHKKLGALKGICSQDFKNSPVFNWNENHRELCSKKFASEILTRLIQDFPCEHFISEHKLPEICQTREDFKSCIKKWGQVMIKAPWSSSGRGLQPITKTPVHEKVWEKIMGTVRDQGYAITEPYLDKVHDMAFQFEITKGKIYNLGQSHFTADQKGQYFGNWINGLPEEMQEEVAEFIRFIPGKIIEPLIKILEDSALARFYEGRIGVDTLIFHSNENRLKINPCLEINVRLNMGLVAMALEKLVAPDEKGIFRTCYDPDGNLSSFNAEMSKNHPLIIEDGKIYSGFFPLTEIREKTKFGAYLLV